MRWSPWHVAEDFKTATLAYVGRNHVGFRRVTLQREWQRGQDPTVTIAAADTTSACMFLSADAFVEWEDAVRLPSFRPPFPPRQICTPGRPETNREGRQIWQEGDAQMARGIIATPFVVKPFQLNLCGSPSQPTSAHSTAVCSTSCPGPGKMSTNPITGRCCRPRPFMVPSANWNRPCHAPPGPIQ